MSDFSYLAVLISIVLGLGITNVLTGLTTLIRRRARVRFYWPMVMWMVTLLLIHVQTWWAMFTLSDVTHWSFGGFIVVLMQPILLFVISALVVPDFSGTSSRLDLHAAFYREFRWFFLVLFLALVDSLMKSLVVYGAFPGTPDLIGHLVFMTLTIVGAISKQDRVQKILSLLGIVLFSTYIAILFATLP